METPEEIENHKKEQCFFFEDIDDEKNQGYSRLIENPNYIDVPYSIMNLRWLKWFSQTEYCKENWENEFDDLVKNKVSPVWNLSIDMRTTQNIGGEKEQDQNAKYFYDSVHLQFAGYNIIQSEVQNRGILKLYSI